MANFDKFFKVQDDWTELEQDYKQLEMHHKVYRSKLEEVIKLRKKCFDGIKHQKYRLTAFHNSVNNLNEVNHVGDTPEEQKQKYEMKIEERKMQISEMEGYLPRESGPYLKLILGNVNVTILDKEAKYQYKNQYEQFKLIVMLLGSMMALASLCLDFRIIDICLMFLCVWYYCTLTIQESILRVNGSSISGWWRAHHFITTVAAGILLIWPDGNCFRSFRQQYLYFCIYVGLVSYMQCYYQSGCLYRLRSLGLHENDMDITVDGFQSWMWKSLTFLLPFLTVGYAWQLYHSYTLYFLSFCEDAEWQVITLSILFAILGIGNISATSMTIMKKIRDSKKIMIGELAGWKLNMTHLHKYISMKKSKSNTATTKTITPIEDISIKKSKSNTATTKTIVPIEEDSMINGDLEWKIRAGMDDSIVSDCSELESNAVNEESISNDLKVETDVTKGKDV